MPNVKKETVNGLKWLLLQKCTLQPLTFLYSMVLARLISPREMGIVGLTAIFFSVATTLSSAGFGSALIRKIDRTDDDCSTAFWFNLGMSVLMGGGLYLAAPWFVTFYNQPELLWLTRCSAIMMVLSSTAGVHWTLYSARRDFKTPAIIQSITAISSMPVTLFLAYMGWGVWALMVGTVTNSSLLLLVVWCVSPWKPRLRFSMASFRELFGFGCKLTGANLLHTIYSHLRTFIIGKFYSPTDLGMYSKGAHLAEFPSQTLAGLLTPVTYPILATLQNDKERLASVYRKYIKTASLPIMWGCILLIALAEPFVRLCFGDVWLPCVIYVQIITFGTMFNHVCNINLSLLQVLGRSDLILRLEFIKKTISVLMLLFASLYSVTAICLAFAVYSQIAVFINCYYSGKFIGRTWWKQQQDYWPYIIIAAASALPAYLISFFNFSCSVKLFIGFFLSMVIYPLLLIWKKDDAMMEIVELIKEKLALYGSLKRL